jgi:hypothetical protein
MKAREAEERKVRLEPIVVGHRRVSTGMRRRLTPALFLITSSSATRRRRSGSRSLGQLGKDRSSVLYDRESARGGKARAS